MKTDALPVLRAEQAQASFPDENIWLSASAGTGKTSVLTARVLRLLLRGVRPDAILCLTFTRAGAAEMAERVHQRLARWAMLDEVKLAHDIFALGEERSPATLARARTLFAEVLDARGGGLRIMTIHAFCQTLLGSFPLEAGLAPGFRAIEGREQAALATRVLAEVANRAEREHDMRTITAMRALSLRLGEGGARQFLLRAASQVDALDAVGEGVEARVRRALEVPADFVPTHIGDACGDDRIDRQGLLDLMAMHKEWGRATGDKAIEAISDWLLGDPPSRGAELDKLAAVWATQAGTLRKGGPKHPGYADLVERLHSWCGELQGLRARAELAADIAHALRAARVYARAYAAAKRTGGYVDFDDLIQRSVALLATPGMGSWIGYKLDTATDHILVDEAQDTNREQWAIVEALADEFWALARDDEPRPRTIFTVGDYKQAIFGFQGTDPGFYTDAGNRFDAKLKLADRTLTRLSLDRSYRSTPPVLDIVDAMLGTLGEDAFGDEAATRHESARQGPGRVTLLSPVRAPEADDGAEEGWTPSATRALATSLARQVRRWLDEGHRLESLGRAVTPGDIMILVRKRGDLAALLVARLHAEKVPVAGVDRLRLAAPLVVKDCLAAIRFAVQPDDDLTLASLLVSPICGWTQAQLFDGAFGRRGSLWRHLREHHNNDSIAVPRALLNMADLTSPYGFLEAMLSGEIGARRALLRRLGNEASDAIDELLNAALQFEREGVATLQGFLDWFDRSDADIVRDPGGAGDAVRVMTVHAAKGLEAPLVILADATGDPDASRATSLDWLLDEHLVPLFRPRASERALHVTLEASLKAQEDRDRREHWRLLYVAMTRAQEQLVIAGSLAETRPTVPEACWHAAIGAAMDARGAASIADPHWGDVRVHEAGGKGRAARPAQAQIPPPVERPHWLDRPPPQEARPPRPLSPSSLGPDRVADPPDAATLAAATRGRLIHALFERLPAIAPNDRRAAADRWLATGGGVVDQSERDALIDATSRVIDHPDFAHLFAPGGMAEVPVAGVVGTTVVSGTIDRLIVGDTTVDLIDFKTQRRVPASADAIPPAHLRQMAAYAALLQGVFPDKTVRAALLYTAAPVLFTLTQVQLAAHPPVEPDAIAP